MIRHVFLEIRESIAEDFRDSNGYPLYGAAYFIQNADLSISKKINYLLPETNKVEFKQLFADGRIYVFANPNEVINVDQCTILEWNEEFNAINQNQVTIDFETIKK